MHERQFAVGRQLFRHSRPKLSSYHIQGRFWIIALLQVCNLIPGWLKREEISRSTFAQPLSSPGIKRVLSRFMHRRPLESVLN